MESRNPLCTARFRPSASVGGWCWNGPMTAIAQHPHRVTRALADARRELAAVAQVPVWSMDPAETTAAIAEVTRAEAQLAELKARLLTHAEQTNLAAESGANSTATWHAVATNISRREAHRAVR